MDPRTALWTTPSVEHRSVLKHLLDVLPVKKLKIWWDACTFQHLLLDKHKVDGERCKMLPKHSHPYHFTCTCASASLGSPGMRGCGDALTNVIRSFSWRDVAQRAPEHLFTSPAVEAPYPVASSQTKEGWWPGSPVMLLRVGASPSQ